MKICDFLGLYIWSDGSKFEGEWKENKITGYVRQIKFAQS